MKASIDMQERNISSIYLKVYSWLLTNKDQI
jgi:hypothetical protein